MKPIKLDNILGPKRRDNVRARFPLYTGARLDAYLTSNPYVLTTVDGIGFKLADEVALNAGIDKRDPRRARAAVYTILTEVAGGAGHSYLRWDQFVREAKKLGLDEELMGGVAKSAVEAGHVRRVNDYCLAASHPHKVARRVYEAIEERRAEDLRLERDPPEAILDGLNEGQARAAIEALRRSSAVLTGGPGTGKTYTLRRLLESWRQAGLSVALAAPTGKAAQRMGEACGAPASTLHRLLGYRGIWPENPEIDADVLVVDESSMLTDELADVVFRATEGKRLLLVGDRDQLPPVGVGAPFWSAIRRWPTATLDEVVRQAKGSGISRAAGQILRGELPVPNEDFLFVPLETEDAGALASQVVNLLEDELRTYADAQVLSATRKNEIGTVAINAIYQHRRQRAGLGEDDRVIHTRNNYDLDVFNGELGIVAGRSGSNLIVEYGDGELRRNVAYSPRVERDQLEAAWALTVHKAQGSEFDAVIVPLHKSQTWLLSRQLLYTAVTRAKRRCVLVGSEEAVLRAVRNNRPAQRNNLIDLWIDAKGD